MKTFTMVVDDKVDGLLDELRAAFGKKSKAEVLRMAFSLLNEAKKARDAGKKLCVTSKGAAELRELIIVS